jgi:glycerol-3-phosphate dehydrogenase
MSTLKSSISYEWPEYDAKEILDYMKQDISTPISDLEPNVSQFNPYDPKFDKHSYQDHDLRYEASSKLVSTRHSDSLKSKNSRTLMQRNDTVLLSNKEQSLKKHLEYPSHSNDRSSPYEYRSSNGLKEDMGGFLSVAESRIDVSQQLPLASKASIVIPVLEEGTIHTNFPGTLRSTHSLDDVSYGDKNLRIEDAAGLVRKSIPKHQVDPKHGYEPNGRKAVPRNDSKVRRVHFNIEKEIPQVSELKDPDKKVASNKPQASIPKTNSNKDVESYDILVIGGGVVGLAVLRAATLQGYKCVLVEAEADLLRGASSANSGIICTGVDASPGSLERALIRDSIAQMRPYLKTHRIPFRDCGSLVCQWEWDKVTRERKYQSPLSKVLAESHDAGDTHAQKLNAYDVGLLEPNISPLCVGAVHIPGEIVVDSWLFSISLAAHARDNGAKIFTSFEFDPNKSWFDKSERIWNVFRRTDNDRASLILPPKFLQAKAIVNATGIVADLVQAATSDVMPPIWKSMPRRGQYRVFKADEYTIIKHPIQPVPTQRTKGIFVYSTLFDLIVVGPTAEDQNSRFDRSIDPVVCDELTSFALRLVPDLAPHEQLIGEFVGIRPATDLRDYQIHLTAESNWVVAAGIRSTGLTASLGIGRHVTTLLQCLLPPRSPPQNLRTSPLPSVKEMADHYNSNVDGNVLIHGYLCKITLLKNYTHPCDLIILMLTLIIPNTTDRVTHPLTQMGFKLKTGIAAESRM